ncbi:MAG: hypothetical protein JNK05_23005 [Myxococcales bacterium]|nr:hypothetical protein [Myxococcales bacterium]
MPKRWMVAIAVWLVFTAYSVKVSVVGGVLGFLGVPAAHPWGLQIVLDLFIAMFVALSYLNPKARKVGVPRIPYVIATMTLGSVGLLLYFAHVEWASDRQRAASPSEPA